MAAEQFSQVVRHLRSILANPEATETPDADLLQRYVHDGDESAFETLLRRHGPMVLGVCRRLLHNSHDAEDAFQVTFLVLVRKASALHSPGTIGNWLYGVAHRTALEARKASAKRQSKEAMAVPRAESPPDHSADLRSVLDQELKRLPDRHREVVVLCDLEGKTRKQAALDLGCAEGTVASRLARARTVLAKRLTRHGLPLSAGALALLLSEHAASASLPPSLISGTLKAAGAYVGGQALMAGGVSTNVAALTQGVLRTMLFTKLKIATAILAAVTVVGVGAGSLIYATHAAQSNDHGKAAGDRPKLLEEPADKEELQKLNAATNNAPLRNEDLRGKWTGEKNGIKVELNFYGQQEKWQAHWQVEYKVMYKRSPKSEYPSGLNGFQVNKGADLKCLADQEKPGRLGLYLPAYLGDNKEIKESSWNGKKPVGQAEKVNENTIQLRIIPTGYENAAEKDFDFPAVEGMILHRVFSRDGPQSAAADQSDSWGTIKGQIFYDDDPIPEPKALNITKDQEYCLANGPILSEDWVVNKKNKGVRWAFVWLAPEPGGTRLPIHPSLKDIPNKEVEIDQPRCVFVPHCLTMREGQILVVKNSSAIAYNVHWAGTPLKNLPGNMIIPPGDRIKIEGLKEDKSPLLLGCNIHTWMKAQVGVFAHPYFAVTDEDGNFEIKMAPAGEHRLKVYHESAGWRDGAAGRNGEKITVKGGGVTDLGKLGLKPSAPAEDDITVEMTPPVVVKTVPQAGMTNVSKETAEIQVTFSKEMMDGSWSWSQLSDGSFPKIIGKPKYLKDKRTCVVTVELEPNKTYAIWLNSEKFHNFKDAEGRSAVPYLLVFKTAK